MGLDKRIESLEARIEILEKVVESLSDELKCLKNPKKETEWKNNTVSDYMIKLVFPGIYCQYDNPTAGFPKNRKSIAGNLEPGQYMFIYSTSPIKKIIGLTKVKSKVKDNTESRWPYYVDLEWVIKPRNGVTLNECGLDIRPRPGDTLYAITEEKANEIITKLNSQKELDQSTIDYLANEYREMYENN